MPSLYKIYTIALGERLREEIEKKDLLPDNQAGFRRGMGTIDQTFTLNYLINRQLGKVKGGLTVLFVDLKAAFDSVDRDILISTMRERGVREGLIDRIEEILRETKSKVKIGNQCSEEFWLARGLRQGCTISPMLFNLLIADMEEYMARGKWGGIKIMGNKSYTLMYADDVALMAEDEQGMKAMISRLERYLEEKGLNLNVEKTKIIRFRKGGGRRHKVDWRWKGKKIEEVREFKYLGYTMMQNGGQEAHIRERRRKAALVMREVWGIGKRLWGKDWKRRIWLYDTLVWTVLGYGAEIWGWKERKEVEGMHERYLRWTLGLEWKTPGYMIREEIDRWMMRGRAGKRAWKFEKRLEEGRGSAIARKCLREMKERWKRGKIVGKWEQERKEFFSERGVGEGEEDEVEYERMEKEDNRTQRLERERGK